MSASMLDLPAETVEIIEKERVEIILKDLKEIGNCTLTGEGLKQKIAPILDLPAEILETMIPFRGGGGLVSEGGS